MSTFNNTISMKKNKYIFLVASLLLFVACSSPEKTPFPSKVEYNFMVVSDMGKTGDFSPEATAHEVAIMADSLHPRFMINSGDMFHGNGVKDTNDVLWQIGFEKLFSTKSLMVDWYSTIGNHEYFGNPQALVDYAKKGGRWIMPERYYTVVKQVNPETSLRIIVLDTSPFEKKYRKDVRYKSVWSQDQKKQVVWLDSVLQTSHETWKIVVGHHPIYTADFGHGNTKGLIDEVDPILHKYNVDFYFCGHIHKFEHTLRKGMNYIVTTSGSKKRATNPWLYTQFYAKSLGFTLCSITSKGFRVSFINERGEELYSFLKKR